MNVPTMEDFEALAQRVAEIEAVLKAASTPIVKEQFVTVSVAKVILNVSHSTVWRMVKANNFALQGSGRTIRISLKSIRDYLKERQFHPAVIEARINEVFVA